MTTFAVTNSNQLLPAVNYLLSNLDTTGSGNVVLPGNVLVANTTTGVVSQSGNTTPFAYLYQYVNLRYSNNASGTAGFDTNSNNYSYFGVFNSVSSSPSVNPSAYQWYEVSPPFDSATSRTLYYSAIGGRQIQWVAASSPPSTGYQVTVANVAIDLDVVTTATGTPGERGPIAVAFVITTADPNTATSAQLTTWFSSSRENITPPIGTGLTPVVGDTATFTYTGAPGNPSATLSYNGSIWIPVDGQVVNGNVIVTGTIAGNAIIANTITATQIATNTITANNIAANTITATNIATGTLTTNLFTANSINGNIITANTLNASAITANTFTANTINGNAIIANTFIANTINGNAIVANTFAANTINGNAIVANTFTANTINGTAITSGSITTDKLAANVLTANTVISTGATLGNFSSPGFWLDGNTGNARFGNTISIGNSANIANNLRIGNSAQIGNSLIIGGNLSVTGLVSSGNLISNTVATLTIQPSAVTSISGVQSGSARIATNASPSAIYLLTGTAEVAVPTANATIAVTWSSSINVTWSSGGSINIGYSVYRSVGGAPFTSLGISDSDGPFPPFVITGASSGFSFVDTATTSFGSGTTYRYQIYIQVQGTSVPYTFLNVDRRFASIVAQNFKR